MNVMKNAFNRNGMRMIDREGKAGNYLFSFNQTQCAKSLKDWTRKVG